MPELDVGLRDADVAVPEQVLNLLGTNEPRGHRTAPATWPCRVSPMCPDKSVPMFPVAPCCTAVLTTAATTRLAAFAPQGSGTGATNTCTGSNSNTCVSEGYNLCSGGASNACTGTSSNT